jgi:hypothetical protein
MTRLMMSTAGHGLRIQLFIRLYARNSVFVPTEQSNLLVWWINPDGCANRSLGSREESDDISGRKQNRQGGMNCSRTRTKSKMIEQFVWVRVGALGLSSSPSLDLDQIVFQIDSWTQSYSSKTRKIWISINFSEYETTILFARKTDSKNYSQILWELWSARANPESISRSWGNARAFLIII